MYDTMTSASRSPKPLDVQIPVDPHWMRALAYATLHFVAAGWLAISGVVAAFAVPTRTGGVALAVNMVAALAYVSLARNRLLNGVGGSRALAIRNIVRSIDWLCTFPPMQVEVLFLLGLNPSTSPNVFVTAPALAALVIGTDLVIRTAFTQARDAPLLWWAAQLVAVALFVVLLVVLHEAAPTAAPNRATIFGFVYIWCAYPLVSIIADGVRWGTNFNPEVLEDLAFTLLDVLSKGGLAGYIALHHDAI